MGDTAPKPVPVQTRGSALARNFLFAAIYVALIPVVAALGLAGAATYFPEATGKLLGPALSAILPQGVGSTALEDAESRLQGAEDRLIKIEADIAALIAREEAREAAVLDGNEATGAVSEVGEEQIHGEIAEATATILAKAGIKDRMLASLTALTLARAEYLSGNRTNAVRELGLARSAISAIDAALAGLPAELGDALAKAEDALSKGSATAEDWLSLAWHLLAEALVSQN